MCLLHTSFVLLTLTIALLPHDFSRLWAFFSSPLMTLTLTPDRLHKAIPIGNQLWIMKSRGCSAAPGWTPTLMLNSSLNWPFRCTQDLAFSCIALTTCITHSSTPTVLTAHWRTFWVRYQRLFLSWQKQNTGVYAYLDVSLVTDVEWRLKKFLEQVQSFEYSSFWPHLPQTRIFLKELSTQFLCASWPLSLGSIYKKHYSLWAGALKNGYLALVVGQNII